MADTEETLSDKTSSEEDQFGGQDYPTVEPREDENPHFEAFHDPPDEES